MSCSQIEKVSPIGFKLKYIEIIKICKEVNLDKYYNLTTLIINFKKYKKIESWIIK